MDGTGPRSGARGRHPSTWTDRSVDDHRSGASDGRRRTQPQPGGYIAPASSDRGRTVGPPKRRMRTGGRLPIPRRQRPLHAQPDHGGGQARRRRSGGGGSVRASSRPWRRNGTEFGIRLSGTGESGSRRRRRSSTALFLGSYTAADANPDIGDSAITETVGLGGFAMAAAPAIVGFVGEARASSCGRSNARDVRDHLHRASRATGFRSSRTVVPRRGSTQGSWCALASCLRSTPGSPGARRGSAWSVPVWSRPRWRCFVDAVNALGWIARRASAKTFAPGPTPTGAPYRGGTGREMTIAHDFDYADPARRGDPSRCPTRGARVLAGGTDLVPWLRDDLIEPSGPGGHKGNPRAGRHQPRRRRS